MPSGPAWRSLSNCLIPATTTPSSLQSFLPAIQAFQGDLVVRGHLGDPVGEKTRSEVEKELPATMDGSSVMAGKAATGGKTKDRSHTHLRARLRGAAHPQSRSTLGRSWGRKRRGEVIGKRLHQAQSCMGTGLAGTQNLAGLLPAGTRRGKEPGLSASGERQEKKFSPTHRHAREDGLSPRRTGTLPWFTLARQEPWFEVAKTGGPLETSSGRSGSASYVFWQPAGLKLLRCPVWTIMSLTP